MIKFHCRIDDGPEQTFEAKTGAYSLACIAALAILTDELQGDIEIWVPDLVAAGYGPYRYRVQQKTTGSGFESIQLIRVAAA